MLSNEPIKPSKFKEYQHTKHAATISNDRSFFLRKRALSLEPISEFIQKYIHKYCVGRQNILNSTGVAILKRLRTTDVEYPNKS